MSFSGSLPNRCRWSMGSNTYEQQLCHAGGHTGCYQLLVPFECLLLRSGDPVTQINQRHSPIRVTPGHPDMIYDPYVVFCPPEGSYLAVPLKNTLACEYPSALCPGLQFCVLVLTQHRQAWAEDQWSSEP